ncbi:MAG: lytic transglycosylase domain-containing protein, partial [Candidatus Aenigmarchaeota archaeon]|nr:lytic transglycosylase domain-containing protein [Candidatus Aenigmarchaeota archaeon]
IWAVLGFLGIFQFYQTGGWKVVLQGGVVILIFSFVALGPYSAYYNQAINQVKTPVEIAYRAVSGAITDIWLLATNPTEWYARQQLVNVRPEKPIDFPKGLEIGLLDALPPSVPGGREFAITTVIKNEGSLVQPALDASLSFACNQWCIVPQPDPTLAQLTYSLCRDRDLLSKDEYYCQPEKQISVTECGEDAPDTGETGMTLDSCVSSCVTKGSGLLGSNCLTRDRDKFLQSFGYIHRMDRGDARAISIRGFTAVSQPGRQGEIRLAEVTVNLSYRYSTSTSLLTEIMTQSEIDRKIQENEPVFRNVLAVTKSSPAQLSLNVGPQPLTAGQKSLLLVSVSNTRDESSVVLKRGTRIIITLPRSVGRGLKCEGISGVDDATKGIETLTYTVPQEITVLPFNFQSIFAFICDFTAADPATVVDVKSALITGEMPDYTFVLTKKKDIPVTPPLGILFDPFENECRKCGDGAFEQCDPDECRQRTNYDSTKGRVGNCYYEYAGTNVPLAPDSISPQLIFGSPCHSCGQNFKCETLITEKSCNEEARQCGASCWWDKDAKRPGQIEVSPEFRGGIFDPNAGSCKEKTVAGTSLAGARTTGRSTGQCDAVQSSFKSAYESRKDTIATAVELNGLAEKIHGSKEEAAALVSAVISQESGWSERVAAGDGGTSFGLMQIRVDYHPECSSFGDVKNDPVANIKCGTRILADLAQQHYDEPSRVYPCTPQGLVGYKNTNAVLRYYNGWPRACDSGATGCCDRGDINYVERVYSLAGSGGNGHLPDWQDCFKSVGTP